MWTPEKFGQHPIPKKNPDIFQIEYKCGSALDAPGNASKTWPHSSPKKAAEFHDDEKNVARIAAAGNTSADDIDDANNHADENTDAEKEMMLSIMKETKMLNVMMRGNEDPENDDARNNTTAENDDEK